MMKLKRLIGIQSENFWAFFFLLVFLGVQGVYSMLFLVPLGLRYAN